MQAGRERGRPRRPCNGGTASSSGNAWVESWQFAPFSSIANGMPRPSQIKWRLLPRLARSVGFGPVCGPQKRLALNNYVWVWSPELGERKLAEVDSQTLTYWNK